MRLAAPAGGPRTKRTALAGATKGLTRSRRQGAADRIRRRRTVSRAASPGRCAIPATLEICVGALAGPPKRALKLGDARLRPFRISGAGVSSLLLLREIDKGPVRVWRAWRAFSQPDRYKFLSLLRGAYAQEREAVLRQHGGRADGVRMTRFSDLALSEADLQRHRP